MSTLPLRCSVCATDVHARAKPPVCCNTYQTTKLLEHNNSCHWDRNIANCLALGRFKIEGRAATPDIQKRPEAGAQDALLFTNKNCRHKVLCEPSMQRMPKHPGAGRCVSKALHGKAPGSYSATCHKRGPATAALHGWAEPKACRTLTCALHVAAEMWSIRR